MNGKLASKITNYSVAKLINSGAIAHACRLVLGDFTSQFAHPYLISTSLDKRYKP